MTNQEDLIALVKRLIYATRNSTDVSVRDVADKANDYMKRKGLWTVLRATKSTAPATQEDALPALPEPYWPGFRPSLDSRVDLFTADQMHSYARAALAARDADLARYRSMYQGMATEAARLKFLALTGQSDAARDDARDAEIARLREALREGERLVRLRWNVQNKEYHLQCKGWLAALWEEKA